MPEYTKKSTKRPLKLLDKTSKTGKIAFKITFGAHIVGFLAFILTILRIFSIYAILTFAICIAIAFIANTILIIDILKFKQLNKSTN